MILVLDESSTDSSTLRIAQEQATGRNAMRLTLSEGQRTLAEELLKTEAGSGLLLEMARGGMRLHSLCLMRGLARR